MLLLHEQPGTFLHFCLSCMQNMLLRRLWEVQQEQERQQAAPAEESMEVESAAAPVLQKSGVVQRELVDWYMEKQLQR